MLSKYVPIVGSGHSRAFHSRSSLLLLFWFITALDNVYLVGMGNGGDAKFCCTFLLWTTTHLFSFNLNEKTSRLPLWGYRWPIQCVITQYSSLAQGVLPQLRGKYSEFQPSTVVMWSFVMKKHPFFPVKHYPHFIAPLHTLHGFGRKDGLSQ